MSAGSGLRTRPRVRSLVDEIDNVKGSRVLVLEGVNLFSHDDVLFRHVREEQLELGLVGLVGESMDNKLVKGGTMRGGAVLSVVATR